MYSIRANRTRGSFNSRCPPDPSDGIEDQLPVILILVRVMIMPEHEIDDPGAAIAVRPGDGLCAIRMGNGEQRMDIRIYPDILVAFIVNGEIGDISGHRVMRIDDLDLESDIFSVG